MPVPTAISDLSTTPGSNSPVGADAPSVLDDHIRTLGAFIRQLSDAQVALTGDQTIAGIKTFSSAPVVPSDSFAFAKLQNIATARILGRSTAGTGDIEELTGTQLAALLPAASDTVAGIQENATDAEAQTGTATNRSVTPDNLGATVLGIGQTWQDLTASRALGVTYTNTSGRTIVAQYQVTATAGVQPTMTISGVIVPVGGGVNGAGNSCSCQAVIPPGATYNASSTNLTLNNWRELRA